MKKIRGGVVDFVGLTALLIRVAILSGQSASPPWEIPTIHVVTDLVQVPVLALRAPFRSVSGLDRDSFVVRLDGGPPFRPSYVRTQDTEPISLGVLVAVYPNDSTQLSKGLSAVLQNWPADLLHSTDRFSLFISGCRLIRSVDQAPANLLEHRNNTVQAASISVFNAALEGGNTCQRPSTADSLETAIHQMIKTTAWKILLVIINGERATDVKSLRKVQAVAAADGISVFTIKFLLPDRFPTSVYSENEGINVLVSSLGGTTMASSSEDLGYVIETIIRNIRQRYILSFPRPENGSVGFTGLR